MMRIAWAAALFFALAPTGEGWCQTEGVASLKVYRLLEKEACGRAYGDRGGCIEWSQKRVHRLEETAPLLEQDFPNDGKIVLSSEQLRFALKDYNDNLLEARCVDQRFSSREIPLSQRWSTVFLFTYADDDPKTLHVNRTVRCGENIVVERGHTYDKPSRL